jgi:hypothetical protein
MLDGHYNSRHLVLLFPINDNANKYVGANYQSSNPQINHQVVIDLPPNWLQFEPKMQDVLMAKQMIQYINEPFDTHPALISKENLLRQFLMDIIANVFCMNDFCSQTHD